MKFLGNKLKSSEKRYIAVGLTVYMLEIFVIFISQQLGASGVVAVAISFWVGLVTSFSLQKIITFQDKRLHHKVLLPQLVAFSLLVLFNFGFTLFVARLTQSLLPPFISRTIALGCTTIWNYYLYHTKIFKDTSRPVY